MQQGLAVRLWWIFPLVLVLATAIAAVRHREQPLSLERVAPDVRAVAAHAAAGASAAGAGEVFLRSRRTQTAGHDWPMDRIEKVRLQPLGAGLVRRSTDAYELVGTARGQRAVVETLSITWRGLIALHTAERVPAAFYHDVFADEGWIEHAVESLQLQPEPGFPQREGSRLQATIRRVRVDAQTLPTEPASSERRLACRSEGTVEAAAVRPGGRGMLPVVLCESTSTVSGAGDSAPTASTDSGRFVYFADLDYFFRTEWSEAVRDPRVGDDAPAQRWGHASRLLELSVSTPAQPSR